MRKRIALLCSGPSLLDTWSNSMRSGYDIVVGVNGAGLVFDVDWLAFLDRIVFEKAVDLDKLPREGIFTAGIIAGKSVACLNRKNLDLHNIEAADCGKLVYTFPDALNTCESAWPNCEIDIYGNEMSEELCVFGFDGDRGAERWVVESAWVRKLWKPERYRRISRLNDNDNQN